MTHADRQPMTAMHPVLTAEAMRAADRYTIDEFGLPGFTLMESAGRETAAAIERVFGPVAGRAVSIYCGKGNNGGDGFVVARCLFDRGAELRVITHGASDDLTPDAAAHFALLGELAHSGERLRIVPLTGVDALPSADIHVDALLGTGLTKDLRDPILGLVRWLNAQPGFKVAIDIPTGLHTDVGLQLGAAFRADLTVTIAALKTGLCMNEGPATAGRIETVPIGIPARALRMPVDDGTDGCAYLSSDEAVRLPSRRHDANKYSVGLALIVAGSEGMSGAPVMAASAAARVGAGYVVCACDYRIQPILSAKLTEVTSIPLPAGVEGIESDGAMEALEQRLEKARGVLIGCGLGRARGTQEFIRRFLKDVDAPAVIDADGLNALDADFIGRHAEGRWILTPHRGEFERLAEDRFQGIGPDDRVRLTQHYAREWNCVLLLKGLPSIVASPDGKAWISGTGNPALATAGTGDILAGLCAGLLAQGLPPAEAAVAAMHIGGAASDRFAARADGRSMQAMDLVSELPFLLNERFHAS